MMRRVSVFVLAAAVVLLAATASAAAAVDVYDQLKSLVGDWEAELPGVGKIGSNVRLQSNGKAITEIIGRAEDNEISGYTLDAD